MCRLGSHPDRRAGFDHLHERNRDVQIAKVGERDISGDDEPEDNDSDDGASVRQVEAPLGASATKEFVELICTV
jgi:hypothetical protein